MLRRTLMAVATAGAFCSTPLVGQTGTFEIGFDLGGGVRWVEGDATGSVGIPLRSVRLGTFVSDQVSVELDVGADVTGIGDDTDALGRGAFQILFHGDPDPRVPRALLGVGAGLVFVDIGGFDTTQFGVGGGVGYEWPFNSGAGGRFGLQYVYSFENDDLFASHELFATLGFSLFLGRERPGRR